MNETPSPARLPFDFAANAKRVHEGPCFVCATVDGHPDYGHDVIYEDTHTIAFLARHPTLLGYSLIAPKRHVEPLESGLQIGEYLRLQEVVYRVAKAVAVSVPTERVYGFSLGSQQGNAHVHWHVAPLPPGVPYEEQQFHAVMAEHGRARHPSSSTANRRKGHSPAVVGDVSPRTFWRRRTIRAVSRPESHIPSASSRQIRTFGGCGSRAPLI